MPASGSVATGLNARPCDLLNLPMEIRQVVYDDVFSYDTFETFRRGYFNFVKTNRQIYGETFDFALRMFRSFYHTFFLDVRRKSNGSFGSRLILNQSGPATNYEHPLPEKVVEPRALRQLTDIGILFSHPSEKELRHLTQGFKQAIDTIVWTFRDQATPMSLTIGLPIIYSIARSGKLLADLEPLASLPAVCDVKLSGNRHWRWIEEEWETKRWSFLLHGKKQKSTDEVMDGFLDRIEKSVEFAAANAN